MERDIQFLRPAWYVCCKTGRLELSEAGDSDRTPAAVPSEKIGFWGYYVLIVCLGLYLFSQVDRQVINVVVDPIKEEFGLDDFKVSLLMGPAFGVPYAICAIVWAKVGDVWTRRNAIITGVLIWTGGTIYCGLAPSYQHLFAARVLVGVGEAALLVNAYVLISSNFPAGRLATALSVLSMGSVGGMAFAFAFGGTLVEYTEVHHSWPWPFDSAWRILFLIVGAPCLPLAAMLLFVRHGEGNTATSASAHTSNPAPVAALSMWQWARLNRATAIAVVGGFGIISLCSAGIVGWAPAYMNRNLGLRAAEAGVLLGSLIVVSSTFGKLGSGLIVDWMFRGKIADAHLRYLMIASVVAGSGMLVALSTGSHVIYAGGFALYLLFGVPVLGYGAALTQLIVPDHLRAQAGAWFLMTVNLLSAGVGPMSVGFLSESIGDGENSLRLALLLLVAICIPVIVITCAIGLKQIRSNPQIARALRSKA